MNLQDKYGVDGRKGDVRVIAANNKNVEEEISVSRFLLNLYYRLNVFLILLPQLLESQGDILLLTDCFLKKYAGKQERSITGFSDKVIAQIRNYI
ncbi:hypothetical protein DIU31_009620 [Mucilaginibacter rubeus]|uniref:Sigma 54-interacting transcriptional regulator n=1 Tax=Mucilaginibacter rubeus TaxID=2027860 RepID=A0AAE6JEE4_9SPHI|nr:MULTISPECIES: sigma 54-interacting transcriptional regulator [Mucilaginibacter]QEM03758.1 hypothetical protein DIU31_009620 [Mucilaginibacter rubeus]QEM16369.1 hypothetical protein DIU38_009715 [Mucilaginibacter gossypii]QTE40863.1 sigma 54-interacting transcriptional regulator [Mucilaginibacter rubeus]QTE47466.1 sigma 54-interacting transcriptional regulator [Mucilaginibacter rubeus]QTE58859.1 sigma 54-interacting transcriptional regulator [Mucilaginibacter rubeus]